MKKCLGIGIKEKPEIEKGVNFLCYRSGYGKNEHKLVQERFAIKNFFYSEPGQSIGLGYARNRKPEPHTLCVTLVQSIRGRQVVPYDPKINSMTIMEITYRDLLLWREGNIEKIYEAGLMPRPKESIFKKILHVFR